MLTHFTIQEIGKLDDGRVAAIVNKQIRAATVDCSNRPGVSDARKITVVLEMKPVCGEDGLCQETYIEAVTSLSTPKSRSKPINMGVRANGALMFNDVSQDNVNQQTLDQADDGRREPKLEED